MFNIPQISFKVIEKTSNKGVFEITPLVKGFGHTIGSALRRTLYSSTQGAAVTKVSIEGVSHEFSTVDGVKDDVFQIMLNLKSLRFTKTVEGPVELKIEGKGPKIVTGADVEEVTGLEVVNKDLVITELSAKTTFKAILTVENGYGYVEASPDNSLPRGTIALDASYTPIVNVVIDVEETRVGRDPNYDKLTLTVLTDGSVDSEEALRNASRVLKEFFYKVQTGEDYSEQEDALMAQAEADLQVSAQAQLPADEVALEELHLPTRTINALRKSGIKTLGDLADRSEDDLLRIRNLGEKSIREIIALLEKEGLK